MHGVCTRLVCSCFQSLRRLHCAAWSLGPGQRKKGDLFLNMCINSSMLHRSSPVSHRVQCLGLQPKFQKNIRSRLHEVTCWQRVNGFQYLSVELSYLCVRCSFVQPFWQIWKLQDVAAKLANVCVLKPVLDPERVRGMWLV